MLQIDLVLLSACYIECCLYLGGDCTKQSGCCTASCSCLHALWTDCADDSRSCSVGNLQSHVRFLCLISLQTLCHLIFVLKYSNCTTAAEYHVVCLHVWGRISVSSHILRIAALPAYEDINAQYAVCFG